MTGHDASELLAGASWRLAATGPQEVERPSALADAGWLPARVPGTAAGALLAAGLPVDGLDERDWWWQTVLPVDAAPGALLIADGLATLAEVWAGDARVADSRTMFRRIVVPVQAPAGTPLTLCMRSLSRALEEKRPRPRWKARIVEEQRLRWFRTSLTGRMPGHLDGPPAVGPFRRVRLLGPHAPHLVSAGLSTRLEGDGQGVIRVRARVLGVPHAAEIGVGNQRVAAAVTATADGLQLVSADVRLPDPALWWPHGQGEQSAYDVVLHAGSLELPLGRTGFRTVAVDRSGDGFALTVNGRPVFVRGTCWSPRTADGTQRSLEQARASLAEVRAAGLNLIRIQGTSSWLDGDLAAICDELGLMLWQDIPLAALDPPTDPDFTAALTIEVAEALAELAGSPALVVVCGGAELDQQPAMLGLDAERSALPLIHEELREVVASALPTVVYAAGSPSGGRPPFRLDQGVGQYFGVGAYRRPFSDIRRSDVRFAAECFAFAVPPHHATTTSVAAETSAEDLAGLWRAGTPRDRGADWDFADVTDHYLRAVFGEVAPNPDPAALRHLQAAAAGECLEALFAEWRREASNCAGGVVIRFEDTLFGPGWGLLDSAGRRKSTWYAARRACAPLALHHTDEGLNGLALHVTNDRGHPFTGSLRLDLLADSERVVETGELAVSVPARGCLTVGDVDVLGAFRDVTRAYRFGPSAFDAAVAVLRGSDGRTLAVTVYTPEPLRPQELGLTAALDSDGEGRCVVVSSVRLARHVVVELEHGDVDDAWFTLLPGQTRRLRVTGGVAGAVGVRASNARVASPVAAGSVDAPVGP